MKLKEQIENYVEAHKDPSTHTFKDGTELKNQKLSTFLINWYNQAVEEWEVKKTTRHADAIKKLIS